MKADSKGSTGLAPLVAGLFPGSGIEAEQVFATDDSLFFFACDRPDCFGVSATKVGDIFTVDDSIRDLRVCGEGARPSGEGVGFGLTLVEIVVGVGCGDAGEVAGFEGGLSFCEEGLDPARFNGRASAGAEERQEEDESQVSHGSYCSAGTSDSVDW